MNDLEAEDLALFVVSFDVADDGCWPWRESLTHNGYATFFSRSRGGNVRAHRWIYEIGVGPIPHGLVIDHRCQTRHCVNPDHLEAVTNHENTLRSARRGPPRSKFCRFGHEFVHQGSKQRCATCEADRKAKRRAGAPSLGRSGRPHMFGEAEIQRIRELYEVDGLSMAAIAVKFGANESTIVRAMNRAGIVRVRSRPRPASGAHKVQP